MARAPSKPWFAPKRYGYGSGLPIAWQGWMVLIAYMAVCIGAPGALLSVLPNPAIAIPAILVVVLVATVILGIICARKTDGGWRWRWGKED